MLRLVLIRQQPVMGSAMGRFSVGNQVSFQEADRSAVFSPHYSWRFVAKLPSHVARPARGAGRTRSVLVQYVEDPRGEPAGQRPVAAANRRLQQKRSWIMRA